MSHVADVQMEVKDLNALRAAVEALGGVWHEGQKTHEWYGAFVGDSAVGRDTATRRDPKTFGKCEHAISVPGITYQIGVVTKGPGVYDLVYDNFGSYGRHDGQRLEQKFGGAGLPLIKQNYSAEVSSRELSRQGYRVTRTVTDHGKIQLKAVR